MKAILSIVLCLAMLLCGTVSLAAEPEQQTSLALSDVRYTHNGETYALDPALRLSGALGEDKAALAFEVESGDGALLPVAAEVASDGLRFRLGNSGKVYTLSLETLMELAGEYGAVDEESQPMIEALGGMIGGYIEFLQKSASDSAYGIEASQSVIEALVRADGGETTAAEIEIDGQSYPVQSAQLDMTVEEVLAFADELRTAGNEEMQAIFGGMLDVCALSLGVEFDSFTGLLEMMDEETLAELAEFSLPCELSYAYGEELVYMSMRYSMDLDGMVADYAIEAIQLPELYRYDMEMSTAQGYAEEDYSSDTSMGFQMSAEVVGPMDAYETANVSLVAQNGSSDEYSYSVYDDEGNDTGEISTSAGDSSYNMTLALVSERTGEGLYATTLDAATLTQGSATSDGEEVYSIDENSALQISAIDSVDEAGDVLTDVHMIFADADGNELTADLALRKSEAEDGSRSYRAELSSPAFEGASLYFGLTISEVEGGKSYAVELGGTDGETGDEIAFTLSVLSEPFGIAMDGERVELTAEILSGEDVESEVLAYLYADVLNLSADAMTLMADPSVSALIEALGGTFGEVSDEIVSELD